MKFAAVVATALLTACASVPRDAGVAEVEQALAARGVERVVWAAQPNASDDPQSLALLRDGELTAEKAVAIAMRNSPRLQVTLAELGIARVALLQESTIPNPLLEVEYRIPADPFHAYELRLAQSLVDLLRLGSRRAIARIGFDAASMRITAAVLRIAAEVRESYYDLLAASAGCTEPGGARIGQGRRRACGRAARRRQHHRSRSRERAGELRAGEARAGASGARSAGRARGTREEHGAARQLDRVAIAAGFSSAAGE